MGQRVKPALNCIWESTGASLKQTYNNTPTNKLLNHFQDETAHKPTESQQHKHKHSECMHSLLHGNACMWPKDQFQSPTEEKNLIHFLQQHMKINLNDLKHAITNQTRRYNSKKSYRKMVSIQRTLYPMIKMQFLISLKSKSYLFLLPLISVSILPSSTTRKQAFV